MVGKLLTAPAFCLPVSAEEVSAAPVQKQGVVVQNVLHRDCLLYTSTGSIMLFELQGATEEFIFRWNVIFQEHPEVLIDKVCQKKLSELMDRMMSYLKTVKEEKL